MEQQSKLLIKQVIGRLLLDTSHYACHFEITGQEGEWTVVIKGVPAEIGDDIKRCLDDLNVFYFEEKPDREPALQKYWLYAKQPPRLLEDAAARRIAITFDTKVPYSNQIV